MLLPQALATVPCLSDLHINSGYMGKNGNTCGCSPEEASWPSQVLMLPVSCVCEGIFEDRVWGPVRPWSQLESWGRGTVPGPGPKRHQDLSNRLFQLRCHFGNWNVKIHDTGLCTATLGRGWVGVEVGFWSFPQSRVCVRVV